MVLRGAAGIGKTAICRRLLELAKNDGWGTVFIAPGDAARPYAVVAEITEQLLRADRRLLEQLSAHARSVLAAVTPLALPAASLPGPLARHEIVGALQALLVATGPTPPSCSRSTKPSRSTTRASMCSCTSPLRAPP